MNVIKKAKWIKKYFILKIYQEGLLIPTISYEVYNSKTKKQLDLSICNDTSINVLFPAFIEEKSVYKYNSSDQYYNDECYTYTTKDGTDITITDRKSEFINNNMSLCEANCIYNGYNMTNKKAKCECKVKKEISSISDLYQNKEILLKFSEYKKCNKFKNIKVL